MKNQILKYSIAFMLCLTSSTVIKAQEAISFKITPELSKSVIDEEYLKDIKIYHLSPKVIDRYQYYKGNVETVDYKILTKRLAEYKPAFDAYEDKVKYNANAYIALKTITDNVAKYLETKDKQLLIDSQTLVDKYEFRVDEVLTSPEYKGISVKEPINLYSGNKPANKSYLVSIIEKIKAITLPKPIKHYNYNLYEETLAKMAKTERYEKSLILSDTLKKDTIYLKDEVEIDINSFSGEFTPDSDYYYVIVEKEVPNMLMKDQILSRESKYYDGKTMINLKNYFVFQSSAGELYCVNDQMYILSLQGKKDKEQKQKEYNSIGTSVAYKEWKTKYKALIQSCSININTCDAIIVKYRYRNIYHQWIYSSDDFSKADKTVFKKNIDSLEAKVHQLSKMEDNRAFFIYYMDHTSTEEGLRFAVISDYFNKNRVY